MLEERVNTQLAEIAERYSFEQARQRMGELVDSWAENWDWIDVTTHDSPPKVHLTQYRDPA